MAFVQGSNILKLYKRGKVLFQESKMVKTYRRGNKTLKTVLAGILTFRTTWDWPGPTGPDGHATHLPHLSVLVTLTH